MTDLAQSSPSLIPINDCVLVQLEKVSLKEGKYDTRTSGIALRVPAMTNNLHIGVYDYLLNKRVYFEEYKEGARIKKDGELYCFIKISDIRGYEDVV